MVPESFEDCVKSSMEANPHLDEKEFRTALRDAVERKKAGAVCEICGEYIWAIGTAIVGWDACFSHITGEFDDSDDFEIDEVCWPRKGHEEIFLMNLWGKLQRKPD